MHSRVARRYASALMSFVAEQKKSEALVADLQTVRDAIASSRELRHLLGSPVIPAAKKREVVAAVFRKKVAEPVLAYLALVVSHGREKFLADILDEFFALRDEALGIVGVDVGTAAKFSAKQEKELVKRLEEFTRKKVRVTFSLDAALKGGFVARIGDTLLDASVRHQLDVLRERLKPGGAEIN